MKDEKFETNQLNKKAIKNRNLNKIPLENYSHLID